MKKWPSTRVSNSRIICLLPLFLLLLLFIILFPDKTQPQTPLIHKPKHPTQKRILFAFLPTNESQDLDQIHENMKLFNDTGNYVVDCMIYSNTPYNTQPTWLKEMINHPTPCEVVMMYKLGTAHLLKTLVPCILGSAGYDYVTIMGRVDLASFEIPRFFDVVLQHGLQVASPAIIGSELLMTPSLKTGRFVDRVGFGVTTFSMHAWECAYELVDAETERWDVNVWFWEYCVSTGRVDAKLGVVDEMVVYQDTVVIKDGERDTHRDFRGLTLMRHDGLVLGILLLTLGSFDEQPHTEHDSNGIVTKDPSIDANNHPTP